jgi:hypothetical protein
VLDDDGERLDGIWFMPEPDDAIDLPLVVRAAFKAFVP